MVQLVKVEESLPSSSATTATINDQFKISSSNTASRSSFNSSTEEEHNTSSAKSSYYYTNTNNSNSNNNIQNQDHDPQQQPYVESIDSNEDGFFRRDMGENSSSNPDSFIKTNNINSFLSPIHHHHDMKNINANTTTNIDPSHNQKIMDSTKSDAPNLSLQSSSLLLSPSSRSLLDNNNNHCHHRDHHLKKKTNIKKISNEEKASRLGEGTIRALRDIALDEALELHQCLRFWTTRLDRPKLFYLEFAPRLLISKDEGRHAIVEKNVSQLQAVLARRCSSIGELQQHLWRAGWQSGVAQWGILGQGSEFAAVIGGGYGEIEEQNNHELLNNNNNTSTQSLHCKRKHFFFSPIRGDRDMLNKERGGKKNHREGSDYTVDSLLHVMNKKGGKIMQNDSALAAWSIDAIRVVRDQLYNAGNGVEPLPCYENWPRENEYFM